MHEEGGKELVESIFFITGEPGTAVLGTCVSSAWSRHNVCGNRAWFVLEQPRTEAQGAVNVSEAPKPILLLCSAGGCHPSSHVTAWALPYSPIPTTVSISGMQRWQISPKNGHCGSDDVLPVFLSHHHLLFVLDKQQGPEDLLVEGPRCSPVPVGDVVALAADL